MLHVVSILNPFRSVPSILQTSLLQDRTTLLHTQDYDNFLHLYFSTLLVQ